jgi:molybdopterin/thiamine biosynthesis adenylyltransferase
MSDRYLRNNMIDWFDQSKVQSLKAIVIGAGAIGNEVIKNLALMGVGCIDIYDFDTIEIHNLTKSVLFREGDIGHRKVDVAAKRARELDPNINVNEYHGDIFKLLTISSVLKADVVFCCLDNFEARLRVNEICLLTKKPMVNMGIDSRYASVEIYTYTATSEQELVCYECNLPLSAYEGLSKRYSCGHLRRISFIEKKIPTTIMTSAAAAAIGVSLGLQKASGKNDLEVLPKKMLIDTRTGLSSLNFLSHNSECACCSTLGNANYLIKTSKDDVANSNFLNNTKSESLSVRFPDTLVTNISCQHCLFEDINFEVSNSRDYTDEIFICPKCKENSVKVDIKDQLTINEFFALQLNKNIFDLVPYFFIINKGSVFCFYEEKLNG